MKLLARYNRVNILTTVVVLLFSSVFYYIMIRSVLVDQLDKDIEIEEQEIKDYIKANNTLPKASHYENQEIGFKLTSDSPIQRRFKSKDIFFNNSSEYRSVRKLVFPVTVAGHTYAAYVLKSQEQTEDLISMILLITFSVVMLLLLILFLANRFLLNKLWQPFYFTLQHLKQFNLSNKGMVKLQDTSINEFIELNQSVKIMSDRVKQDYESLKNFTENASHEMQTPLAIINSRLDVLIQDDKISEHQMQQLQGIYDALDRLSKLNQSLLLLTKIENNQFTQIEQIPLHNLIPEKFRQFEELIAEKQLAVTIDMQPVTIQCNKQLVDVLFSNLLNNAIRYNYPNGFIRLYLTNNSLQIVNSSLLPGLDEQKIFQRFYRHTDTKAEGNGLGLSIIKQICDAFGYKVNYGFKEDTHSFKILFA